MRIADRTVANNFITSFNKSKTEVQRLEVELATNSKINKPSDSPSGTSKLLRLNDQLANNETYKSNIENGTSYVESTIALMENMYDEIESINQLVVEINNPINADNNELYATQVDEALKSLMDLANSEVDGKYAFGGTDFSAAPYGFEDSPAAGTSAAVELKVASVSGVQNIKTGKGTTQQINITGEDLFGTIGGSDIFNTLVAIRDNLKAGNHPTDAQTQTVRDFGEHLLNKISSSGNTINTLTSTSELVDGQALELKSLISDVQEVDSAEAIMELQSEQYALELSYKMSSMILPKSLLDYM